MSPIQLLLATLADLARSKGAIEVAEYLELASVTAGATKDDKAAFATLTAEIQAMVSEGRGPTAVELTTVRSRRDELSKKIRNL